MDEHQVKEELEFIGKVANREIDNTRELLCFLSTFMKEYQKAEEKLPYNINLIDELHADENAHSRILAKLLQQKTPYGKFEILESFVQYLQEKAVSFRNIQINSPEITQEMERIDLWILDEKNYAIIIENKIHRARDMEEQLARYIEKTIQRNFEEEQIYVIYLSRTYDEKHDEQTWGNYKNKFKDRFLHLSFREDIMTWLTDKVLPNVRLKDKFLTSALVQYIDHLEGMFDLRKTNNILNMELQEFIKEKWELNDDNPQKYIAKLLAKQEEFNKINNQIELLKKDFEQEMFHKLKMRLDAKYPHYHPKETGDGVELVIPIEGTSVRACVICALQWEFCCQVDMAHLKEKKDRNMPHELAESLKNHFTKNNGKHNNEPQYYKFFPRYEYDKTYDFLLEVISIIHNAK